MPFRILVIRLSSMGDVIHTLPAVAALKRSFPESHLAWAIRPRWAPLLEGNPFVDEIIPFERGASRILPSLKRLRQQRFDLAIDFQGLIQSALLGKAARVQRIVGLDRSQAREGLAALFYSLKVSTRGIHRVDRYLDLAAAAGASGTSVEKEFPLPPGEPEGTLPEGKFVLACPLAGWGAKQWPLEYYQDLAQDLRRNFDLPLVVNGPAESAALLARIKDGHSHLSGLAGLIHATRRAHAVVGVDSGPLHLAAALAKPGVAIYGPTDPATHGPYGGSIRVLRSPTAVTSYKRRPEEDPSMRAIDPHTVMEALGVILGAAGSGLPRNSTPLNLLRRCPA
jgi:heptosyltransferase-1